MSDRISDLDIEHPDELIKFIKKCSPQQVVEWAPHIAIAQIPSVIATLREERNGQDSLKLQSFMQGLSQEAALEMIGKTASASQIVDLITYSLSHEEQRWKLLPIFSTFPYRS